MKIGILGGTFDPIHNGHLHLARQALKRLSLDKVIFVPAHLPPHKKNSKIAPAHHRYGMVKLAINNTKVFEISDVEIKRKGRSYSVETLKQLKRRFGPRVQIFFITGSDSLEDIESWKNLREILRLCRFVIVKRPCFKIKKSCHDFMMLDIEAKDISATDIRNRIGSKKPVKRLMPDSVIEYIKRHNLYL